jgi:TfoX/Sxy family transcriptional regulator of competence genes
MASSIGMVEYVIDQAGFGRRLEFRKMFGEYALYLDAKVVALVCDDELFLKPTPEGRLLLGTVVEAPPGPAQGRAAGDRRGPSKDRPEEAGAVTHR